MIILTTSIRFPKAYRVLNKAYTTNFRDTFLEITLNGLNALKILIDFMV